METLVPPYFGLTANHKSKEKCDLLGICCSNALCVKLRSGKNSMEIAKGSS